jgi:SAM-dependent methyltransferase
MVRFVGDSDPPAATLPDVHFDQLYAKTPDPWGLSTQWYEQRKHAVTVASLPRQRYRNAYEPGCSIGVLTRLLAPRCEQLLAVDFAAAAVDRARAGLSDFPQVRIEKAALPREMPDDRYDLIVVSEILYYMAKTDLGLTISALVHRLEPGGDIVAVHHRARDRCYGYDGFNVHGVITAHQDLIGLVHHEDQEFVLDVLRRTERPHHSDVRRPRRHP